MLRTNAQELRQHRVINAVFEADVGHLYREKNSAMVIEWQLHYTDRHQVVILLLAISMISAEAQDTMTTTYHQRLPMVHTKLPMRHRHQITGTARGGMHSSLLPKPDTRGLVTSTSIRYVQR